MWLKKDAFRRYSRALLLPCGPVRKPATGLYAGHRLLPADGPRHDPGRPRGRPGQLELNFTYDDALRTADRLTTYRQICAQVAREFDIIACFMCKPFMGVSANGCHHNISLWKGGKDEFKPLGNDAENLPGLEAELHLPARRREHFHAATPAMCRFPARSGCVRSAASSSISAASPRSAARRSIPTAACGTPGFWAPVFADWGFQNRTTGLRISAPGRFEYRAVDSMVNPYLMAAGAAQGDR